MNYLRKVLTFLMSVGMVGGGLLMSSSASRPICREECCSSQAVEC
jgi:hypothetical protein